MNVYGDRDWCYEATFAVDDDDCCDDDGYVDDDDCDLLDFVGQLLQQQCFGCVAKNDFDST